MKSGVATSVLTEWHFLASVLSLLPKVVFETAHLPATEHTSRKQLVCNLYTQ
uniref:Uncharacterized protein n=1 Tax=Anguilla anguilla TaxID=7936 RepID=A0A0E9SWS2_ANGAN